MYAVQPHAKKVGAGDGRRLAKHLIHARRPDDGAVADVPVPGADLRGLLRHAETTFHGPRGLDLACVANGVADGATKGLWGEFAFGEIVVGAGLFGGEINVRLIVAS